jgi:hypothetical protein
MRKRKDEDGQDLAWLREESRHAGAQRSERRGVAGGDNRKKNLIHQPGYYGRVRSFRKGEKTASDASVTRVRAGTPG